jgi:hypothetical protein
VRPAPPAREALAAAAALETALAAIDLRLRAGDERGQAVNAAIVGDHRLRLRLWLILRLRTMLAGLLLLALIGLALALMIALTVVAHIGLLLHRNEAGLLPETRKIVAFVLALLCDHLAVGAWLLRLVLPELLLGRRDQAEIVFGVLVVVLGRNGIARRACVARELDLFFGHMGCGAADLDVGPVGFKHPGHRVLPTPVVIVVVIIVPVTHPLVILTVSHVLPLLQP